MIRGVPAEYPQGLRREPTSDDALAVELFMQGAEMVWHQFGSSVEPDHGVGLTHSNDNDGEYAPDIAEITWYPGYKVTRIELLDQAATEHTYALVQDQFVARIDSGADTNSPVPTLTYDISLVSSKEVRRLFMWMTAAERTAEYWAKRT